MRSSRKTTPLLLHQPLDQSPLPIAVWRILQWGFEPKGFVQNAFHVREILEPVLAMVPSNAAVANTAKGQMAVAQMHVAVVDAATAKRQTMLYFVNPTCVFAIHIQRQGLGLRFDLRYNRIQIGEPQQRQ